ncbi:hypothetical protein MOQ72_27080 [Saccharopolyspora sp. K220]|uniref:hypothetical protein n=1 Tax=Saccharopolyspora soli TaxID=2926618 RepID=UPI001F59828A|nr:hypothetical protein [Saccharopolyspora soli]MCI2421112.1 hypothetical protein [Saccharopolyspora soli]
MTAPKPREIIARTMAGKVVPDRPYPTSLPDELAPWHCYLSDCGHSIAVAVAKRIGPHPTEDDLVPAPVKTVLRVGWTMIDGYVVCDLPYHDELGLLVDEHDEELDSEPPTAHAPLFVRAVGRPYNPQVTQWPDGRAELVMALQGAEFLLFFGDPKPHEIKAFRGNAEFGLLPSDRWLMWLYRFTDPHDSNPKHGISWSDSVWQYHRATPAGTPGVPGQRGTTFLLNLILIDSNSGIIKAMRQVSPPTAFCDALRDAVQRQKAVPDNQQQAFAEIQTLYAQYDSLDLLTLAQARFEALRDDTAR